MKIALSAIAGAALSALTGWLVLGTGLATDFAVLWAAHQVANPYDIVELRGAIGLVVELPETDWPYPYPPTFLLLTAWFKLLPFGAAYLLWLSLSGGALAAAARHPISPLLLFSPWVIYGLMAGQTSLVLGALILFGLVLLDRPVWAGVLLGLAACIKPQLLVFAVIGLAFASQWRALAAMMICGVSLALVSEITYGAFVAWLDLMPRMMEYTDSIGSHLDLPGWPLKIGVAVAGLPLLWLAFRRGKADEKALTAGGLAILCMPHSLWYNAAVIAPALLSVAMRRFWPLAVFLLFKASSLLIVLTVGLSALTALRGAKASRPTGWRTIAAHPPSPLR